MSTTVAELIVQAFREGNFTAVGETTTAEEMLEAVPRLRNYVSALLGIELGEQLRDWHVPQAWNPAAPLRHPLTPTGDGVTATEPWVYPPQNVRLLVTVTAPRTLYFPAAPSDGARMAYIDAGSAATVTLDGNGRRIEGDTTMEILPGVLTEPIVWFYRADLGNWIRLVKLEAEDEVPLPDEFDDLLVTGLCMRMSGRMGVQLDEGIGARNGDMLARLKKRYKQSERIPSTTELRSVFRAEI